MTVTALVPAEKEETAARWRPVRAGILNIWRYYDEVLEFHKGRLLLRGPNGSGKSKALELLLPYLLDASLKPSRLSTFGGSERTMHWNLMGDGHTGKTRVGYVWLEFAHGSRWFTCGARLQATANTRNVAVAYFSTAQRVGIPGGLSLTGAGGQPLTRAHLGDAIGAYGKVHDSAEEYRTAVRRTLFGGLTEQRYDSLLTALRQLRTPKLSERLDPGLLSDLLSSALPPLGEGEIHEIAEGFERLDRQREELRRLDEHVQEAGRLAARQRTYAQRVLRAAAARLVSATSTMDGLTARARTGREEHERASRERDETAGRLAEDEARGRALAARIDGLKESDAYRAGHELADLRERVRAAGKAADQARRTADKHAADAQRRGEEAEQAQAEAATQRSLTGRALADTRRAADRAGLAAVHEEALAAAAEETADGVHRARGLLRAAVRSREDQIGALRAAIQRHRAAVERRDDALSERDQNRARLDEAVTLRDGARRRHEQERDRLAEALDGWARGCVQLAALDAEALVGAVEDERECDELVFAARTDAVDRFAADEAGWRARRAGVLEKLAAGRRRRADLAAQTAVEPDAPGTRPADRAGRPGGPLWRLVAFAPGVAPAAQAGVEAALQAAGLLDAWVLPDGALLHEEHDAFATALLARPAPGTSLAEVLVAEPGSPVPAEVLHAVLSGVACAPSALETDHPAVAGMDGSWRLGTLTGRWTKPEPAFIGATARERARRRRIAALDAEIGALEAEEAACDEGLGQVGAARAALDAELGDRPPYQPLGAASGALDAAERALAQRGDELKRAEERLRGRESAASTALRALTALGAENGLPVGEPALDALAGAVRDFRDNGQVWLQHCDALRSAGTRAAAAARTAGDYEATAAESAERARDNAEEAAETSEKLAAIDASIGVEHRQVLENLRKAKDEAAECETRCRTLRRALLELEKRLGRLEEAVGVAERARDDAVAARDQAAARFRHLVTGHLADDAGLDARLDPDRGVKATLEGARSVAASLDRTRTPYEPKNVRDAEDRLSEAMHRARDVLADQADLELAPDEDVKVLTATMNGMRVGAAELSTALRAERDRRRQDITDKERDLFDRTLAGDTRRHLADRIRQATELVDGMNRRLERVRTASRVAVRLVWQVDPQQSAGIRAARDLLLRDPARLSGADREALYRFFRDRVEEARAANTAASWEEQLMEVLDYTAWHRFTVRLERGDGKGWQDLTRKLHGALSGGEKAIALHLPLFAAVAAHYQTDPRCPRFILLDEVFVGVDTTNRGQVFDLLVNLELDMVLTSDHEWCDYRELDGIAIHQLITGADGDGDNAVTTARFIWNGHRTEAVEEGVAE
ncbi:TIGR02680 family protein [Actinomadura sp. NAK00032]|uniref:TIGR02680 family protein n=1 Tax=Actinomadura sp. NAK00032 TaxID=2742128 RepID=UPI00159022DA|nr:TIGR02680 family protein [Actinomadura sp. NAK00032]QKW34465.1 TIGR02680 family protein [Actinomadura sp. NAK00032]